MTPLAAIPGLEHITRYENRLSQRASAKLKPGEYYVTRQSEELVTVTGSSIAVALFDRGRGVLGLSHFSLPDLGATHGADSFSVLEYGRHALELLVTASRRQGARKAELRAMVFGGAALWSHADVARRSLNFARRFLAEAGVEVVAEQTAGGAPLKLWIRPERVEHPTVLDLPVTTDTVRWREDTLLDELALWAGASSNVISEHRILLRHLQQLERAIEPPFSRLTGRFAAQDVLDALLRLLPEHFRDEEKLLYEDLYREQPRFRATLDQLRLEHRRLPPHLVDLRRRLASNSARGLAEVVRALREVIAMIRAHEQIEGELLHQAYTTDPDPAT